MTEQSRPCAIYARVSTASQDKDPWGSIPRQVEVLRGVAERYGLEVVAEYREQISGAKSERPLFSEMMTRVQAGEVKAVLVATFDRLTRTENLGEFEGIKAALRAVDCELYTADQGRIPMDGRASSELVTDIQAAIAKSERLRIRERTMAGREAKAKSGGYYGHPVPYGYRVVFDPGTGEKVFKIHEEEAEVVRLIFQMYSSGIGTTPIMRRLQEEGIPPPRNSERWWRSSLDHMIQNALYAGLNHFRKPHLKKGQTGKGEVLVPSTRFDAIISLDTWNRAKVIHDERHAEHAPKGRPALHPLSSLLRCTGCGRTMIHSNQRKSYYSCRRGKGTHMGDCPQPTQYGQELAHEVVLRFLQEKLPAYREEIERARPNKKEGVSDNSRQLARANKRLEDLTAERIALVRRLGSAEGVLEEEIMVALRAIREEVDKAQAAIGELEAKEAEARRRALSFDALPSIVEVLAHLTPEHKALRQVFRGAIKQVYLRRIGKDPHDKRRWLVEVDRLQLVDGNWLSGV